MNKANGAREVRVNGIVQGVGFRPHVARLARSLGLSGWVLNDPDGVLVHAEGPANVLDEFERRVVDDAPPAAQIASISSVQVNSQKQSNFDIAPSQTSDSADTLVSPDLATCPQCLAELFDPNDRRFHYPFINCTNCGPRFTIIEKLPYDRRVTSMKAFKMCDACAAEYADDNDRRYHAQPDACFECGPRLWLSFGIRNSGQKNGAAMSDLSSRFDEAGNMLVEAAHISRGHSDKLLIECAQMLQMGRIVAIKSLGGWHLACDASNETAVAKLRRRKRRPTKPLALMVRDVSAARALCEINETQAKLLESPMRPIVLLRRIQAQTARRILSTHLANGIADQLPELGIMLPATPLQHLLLSVFDRPVVMTSGNRSGEPIVATDRDALEILGHIADGFLGNNRAIVARYDDSVLRVTYDNSIQMVRRARGYAPAVVNVPSTSAMLSTATVCANRQKDESTQAKDNDVFDTAPESVRETEKTRSEKDPDSAALSLPVWHRSSYVIFGAGSEQKATICWLRGSRAYVSQHLGDLEQFGAWQAWEQTKKRYEQLFDLTPNVLACDLHPSYLSSKWARTFALEHGLPLVEVQHHHAHIASVLGENALIGPVIGVAVDGTGYGIDRSIWGCEVLVSDRCQFKRFWHLPTFRLPGTTAAIMNPARTAYALVCDWENISENEAESFGLECEPTDELACAQHALIAPFTKKNPQWATFLDELDLRDLLQQMLTKNLNSPQCSSLGRLFDAVAALLGLCEHASYDGEPACLLEAAAERELAADGANASNSSHTGSPLTALSFHHKVAQAIIEACEMARTCTGIEKVALSGGCMVNRLLLHDLREGLSARGMSVYVNRELPPGDGCIAYGQTIVARARLEHIH